eukprot:m.91976 g.91976  ORF g.91976 m.91976 type:complete len:309 (+) comp8497_c0_seq1:21-947(+)
MPPPPLDRVARPIKVAPADAPGPAWAAPPPEQHVADQPAPQYEGMATATEQPESIEKDQFFLTPIMNIALAPLTCLCSWFVLNTREEAVVLQFGKYVKRITTPGWNYYPCIGRSIETLSTATISMSIPDCKVVDYEGNPIVVSAIVQYSIRDAEIALLTVDNYKQYLRLLAGTVLRHVLAQYPFQAPDKLKSIVGNLDRIGRQLATSLDSLVAPIGLQVHAVRIDELSYAVEVAGVMLRKQAAASTVAARKLQVEAAVGITADALHELTKEYGALSQQQQADIVINLMTLVCSGKSVVPVLNMRSGTT